MTTNDTAAALAKLLDDVACRRCDHDDPIGDVGREEIDRAITSHVAAEVARALACAPEVEEAIGDVTVAWWDEAIRQCGRKEGFVIDEPDDRTTSGIALRAAIAADKARAVDCDAIALAADLIGRHLAPTSSVAREAVAKLDAILKGERAAGRPTPDEARRLVEAHHLDLLSIADTVASLHGAPGPGLRGHCVAQADKLRLAAGAARAALLRALGVEA
ncbi:MAG: hypothetical protein KA201_39390 [Kofleriaceae bacterium]|nr:hypothetical protein [Kofleriaceae bacterium]